jgi:hypothetical protein
VQFRPLWELEQRHLWGNDDVVVVVVVVVVDEGTD